MKRITLYRRRVAVRFWLVGTNDERLGKAYERLVDAERR